MRMKGFLCSKDGSVALSRNSMTVGRHDCDINIDDPRVESCHAVLEFCPEKCCYVLRDLNTPSGTYVNECKVQNSAVYITNCDTIRFGQGGKPFELRLTDSLDNNGMATASSLQRPMSAHTLGTKDTFNENPTLKRSLPDIHTRRSQIKPFSLPRPPTRPRSACEYDRLQAIPVNTGTSSPPTARQAWGGGTQHLDAIMKPKLQNLLQMVNEMGSLAEIDDKATRKDAIVHGLRDQITEICQQMDENDNFTANQNFAHELYHIEKELEERRSEVSLLRQQLDSAMQSSPTMTTQLAEKDKLIHELRHDLDKSKREYSMSQGLVQSLQRELSVKEAEIKRKGSELSLLQRNLRDKDIQFQSLSAKFVRVHDCRTKDEAINNVNEEMKTLKQKIRRLESRSGDHTSLINRYKNEITQLNEMVKKLQNEKEASAKNMEQQKGKYLEVQRAERLLRVDVEQAKSRLTRFRGKITKILYSASGVLAPDRPADAEDSRLIVDLETIIDQREKDKEEIRTLSSELELKQKEEKEKETSVQALQETMEDVLSSLAENGHHIDVLRNKRDDLSGLELEKSVIWVRKMLIDLIRSEEQWLQEIYNALRKANYSVEVAEKTPGYFITQLHQDLLDKQNQIKELENSVKDTEDKHKEQMEDKVKQIQATLTEEIEKVREEEKGKREELLTEMRSQLEADNDITLQEASGKLEEANKTIDDLKAELQAEGTKIEALNLELENLKSELEKSKENETALQEDLKTVLLQQKEDKTSLTERSDLVKKDFEKEIEQYKEEIKQHSITIVKMEERVRSIMKQLEHAQKETESLRAELRETDAAKHRLAPSPPVVPPPMFDINGYETTIAALRSELVAAQTQLHMQQTEILSLRRDIASSEARISDMRGELSEPLKEQLESGNRIIREKELENSKLRESVYKLSKTVDKQKAEIQASRKEIKDLKQAVVPHESNIESRPRSAGESRSAIPKVETAEACTQESRVGKINAELTSLGAECKGERHAEIINRQREALAELRARIKALNQVQPISPGNEELVQQVMLLKKELAEIRARQVMENDSAFRDHLSFSHSGDASARDMAPTEHKPMDAEIERTARLQLEDSLNMSEQTYMDMCNIVGGLLNIGTMSGMRSANHMPVDERQRLSEERRQDLELISQQIKSITNRLERKDNLLQNYDKDLAKLREAEEKASQKTAKVSVLLDEVTTKNEENAHLREALRRTEERLNQEKRLNTAIKQKKTFHLENLDQRHPPPKHGECITSEFADESARVRKRKDKSNFMKKEYEIQMLKQKLRSQEQELCQASAQAANFMQHQPSRRRSSHKTASSDTSSVSSKSSRSSRSRQLA